MTQADRRWFGFWRVSETDPASLPLLADFIDPDWQPEDRADLLRYIETAVVVAVAASLRKPCPLCGQRLSTSCFRSDGTWLWPCDLGHYVAIHGVRICDAFAGHIRGAGYAPPDIVDVPIEKLPWPR